MSKREEASALAMMLASSIAAGEATMTQGIARALFAGGAVFIGLTAIWSWS